MQKEVRLEEENAESSKKSRWSPSYVRGVPISVGVKLPVNIRGTEIGGDVLNGDEALQHMLELPRRNTMPSSRAKGPAWPALPTIPFEPVLVNMNPLSGVLAPLRRREQTGSKIMPVLHWGRVLIDRLRDVLPPKIFGDLRIQDFSQPVDAEDESRVCIGSWRELRGQGIREGNTGLMSIRLFDNNPKYGVSSDSSVLCENDFSIHCRSIRKTRIDMRPYREVVTLIVTMERTAGQLANGVMPTRKFSSLVWWRHGTLHRSSPDEHLRVYHEDYNCSYAVVEVVERAIRMHYLGSDTPTGPAVDVIWPEERNANP
jgi:hypothetical protein